MLFDYALKSDQVWALEKICMQFSAERFAGKRPGMLFVNVEAELIPQYIKISTYLVTGLSEDSIKRDVVEMLVRLAERIDAQTVAEGIETEAEKAEIKRLGVTYGQGYLLGRPVKLN